MSVLRTDIPLFPGGKKKAFTLSYDDGVTQDERFISLLDAYGVKCTFNLNSGLFGEKEIVKKRGAVATHHKIGNDRIAKVYENHEIAVHSLTHADLVKVPAGTASYEISRCRKELEDIAKQPITGMAYPFGTYHSGLIEVARSCGISYARTTKSTFSFDLPEDFLAWHPTCHHREAEKLFGCLDAFLEPITDYRKPEVFYLWGHTFEFDIDNQWEMIEQFLEKASGKEEVWYATNGEIRDYLKAVERLEYSASGCYITNPSCIDVWMMIGNRPYRIEPGQTITVEL